MPTKLNTRIKLKRDTTANWDKAIDFIPLEGEVIIYTDYQITTVHENGQDIIKFVPGIKVGDGDTLVKDLPFVMGGGSGGGGQLESDLTVSNPLGKYEIDEVILEGTPFDTIFRGLLSKTYYPTLNSPSAVLTYGGNTLLKVGDTISPMNGSVNFDPGSIVLQGKKQNNRAGNATSFTLKSSGANNEFSETNDTGQFNVTEMSRSSKGNITLKASVAYEAGPQPKDSDGLNYGSPLPAGTASTTKTMEFILPFYWGASDNPTVLDLSPLHEDLSKKSNKTYAYTTKNQYIVFAYDASYGNLTSILDQNGFETISGYKKTTVSFEGQNYFVWVSELPSTDIGANNTFKF